MSEYLEKAKELRNSTERHYNCAQGALVPFAQGAGLDDKTAAGLTANFGSTFVHQFGEGFNVTCYVFCKGISTFICRLNHSSIYEIFDCDLFSNI